MNNEMMNEIYKLYGRELYMYILSFCKNNMIAEDLLQETFLKAMLSLSDSHTNVRAWLYMVARNLCINYLRNNKKELQLDNDSGSEVDFTQNIINDEIKSALYRAINKLPDMKKEVILLHYFGGLKLNEIAHILNISKENARVLNHRAKIEIKQYIEEEKL